MVFLRLVAKFPCPTDAPSDVPSAEELKEDASSARNVSAEVATHTELNANPLPEGNAAGPFSQVASLEQILGIVTEAILVGVLPANAQWVFIRALRF
ncbi:hypothetical protein PIB30_006472 [Stylosanthes scabra]|uniref:Uncharacterized protein n=1 Tax=Stylosanthes scabra TaxID=79078 RepID=A0ABU6V336_9FABA|nr:hypothetical protein [Stylosanthes scabra]